MIKKRSTHATSSLKTAIFFISIVVVVLVIAISVKVVETMQKSIFDGQHQFILLFQSPQNKATLVAIDPSDTQLSALYITNPKQESIQKDIPLGIDATIQTNLTINTVKDIQHVLLASASMLSNQKHTNITWYDFLRLYFIAKTMNTATITEYHITLPANQTDIESAEKRFIDPSLQKESAPIQIINASDITGKASSLEVLLNNTGYSVIDVRTNPTVDTFSVIRYYGTISYSLKKLQRILGYPIRQVHQQMIGAIQIVIGKDANRFAQF